MKHHTFWFDGPGWQAPHTVVAGVVRRQAVQP